MTATTELESAIDTAILWALDFDEEVECESPAHFKAVSGHVPEQKAAVYIERPCCRVITPTCQGAREHIALHAQDPEEYLYCALCRGTSPACEWKEVGLI